MTGTTTVGPANPFDPRVVAAIVVVGVVGFIAMWALIALGPSLAKGNDGGEHGLSRSAAGFAGIIDMTERADGRIWLDRSGELDSGLLVLTPPHDAKPEDVAKRLKAHDGAALIILPKWRATAPRPKDAPAGWSGPAIAASARPALLDAVRDGLADAEQGPWRASTDERAERIVLASPIGGPFAPAAPSAARLAQVQHVVGKGLVPLLVAPDGRILLAQVDGREAYILAEPDLINNRAFADLASARRALALLNAVTADAGTRRVIWDVTLNGLGGGGASFVRLAFVPPFIGITLCLIMAGLLALWAAAVRFGPALVVPRALPLSQRALIDNSVALIIQARRAGDSAGAWLASWREGLARALHAPAGLTGDTLDRWLDARRPRTRADADASVPDLALRLMASHSDSETIAHAGALHHIRKELLRDH